MSIRLQTLILVTLAGVAALCATPAVAQPYALILKGGHVIDPKNGRDGVMDVAIADGKIAEVASSIDAAKARTGRRCQGPVRGARPHRPACPRVPRHRAGRLSQQRHGGGAARQPLLPQRADHAGGRRWRRLAQLPAVQGADHRHVEDPGPVLPQHRRRGHARRPRRAGPRRHGRQAHGDAHPPAPGPHRRHQGGALQRARVGSGRRARSRPAPRPTCR